MWNREIAERYWNGASKSPRAAREERAMFSEYLTIDNKTDRIEFRELTDTMAENLSETAAVVSLNFQGDKTTVWENRVPRTEHVDRSTLLEIKRRVLWRDAHLGWTS